MISEKSCCCAFTTSSTPANASPIANSFFGLFIDRPYRFNSNLNSTSAWLRGNPCGNGGKGAESCTARCAEISSGAIPLFCDTCTLVTEPSRWIVKVTTTAGAVISRGFTSEVFQLRVTASRISAAYAPYRSPNGELPPTFTPPPPLIPNCGELTRWPALENTWLWSYFC